VADGASYVPSVHGYNGPVDGSFIVSSHHDAAALLDDLFNFQDPLRAPESQALYKQTMPQIFKGLKVGKDFSARTGSALASTYDRPL
jgi:choline dehydrogenase